MTGNGTGATIPRLNRGAPASIGAVTLEAAGEREPCHGLVGVAARLLPWISNQPQRQSATGFPGGDIAVAAAERRRVHATVRSALR